MTKAIKKAQRENTKNIKTTQISEESLAYLKKIENNKLTPFFGPKKLSDFVREYLNGEIIVNRKYQRKPNQWSEYLNQLFLVTLFEQGIVTPLVLANMSHLDPSSNLHELIDGQQRAELMVRWYQNDIKLPMYIPEELGGGKFRNECPNKTKELIDGYMVWFMFITPKNEDQIYSIYNRIQKGARFTFGQDLRGHQGTFKELIMYISKQPFINHMYGRDEDWELQTAGYLYMSVLYDENMYLSNNYERDTMIRYLEEHANDKIPDKIKTVINERVVIFNKIFEKYDLKHVVPLNMHVLSKCINKAIGEYTIPEFIEPLGQAFNIYLEKLNECKTFNKLELKQESPFTPEYVEQIKKSPYYPVALGKHAMNVGNPVKLSHEHLLWNEFKQLME